MADAARLPIGALAAVEVAEAGASVGELCDPLRLAVLLGLGPDEARAARHAARAVAGRRTALVVREAGVAGSAPRRSTPPCASCSPTGRPRCSTNERAATARQRDGAARSRRRARAGARRVLVPAAGAARRPGPSPAPARRRALALAVLARGDSSELLSVLAQRTPGGARVVCDESEAAMLGAATTPRAGRTPFVLDLGGGTVDLHREGGRVTAGAGELVTRICPALLGVRRDAAERAKRHRARVSRRRSCSTTRTAPAASSASRRRRSRSPACACSTEARRSRCPHARARGLGRAARSAKQAVLARNVRRALDAAGGVPRGELVTLVGGCASDPEVIDAVAAELGDLDVAVARGDVLGRHGPRAAVAVGLVLAYAAGP